MLELYCGDVATVTVEAPMLAQMHAVGCGEFDFIGAPLGSVSSAGVRPRVGILPTPFPAEGRVGCAAGPNRAGAVGTGVSSPVGGSPGARDRFTGRSGSVISRRVVSQVHATLEAWLWSCCEYRCGASGQSDSLISRNLGMSSPATIRPGGLTRLRPRRGSKFRPGLPHARVSEL